MSNPDRDTTFDPPRAVARCIIVGGQVQGVGFRPFVYRLALNCGIAGTVQNLSGDVLIHAEGRPAALADFQERLCTDAPALARPHLKTSTPTETRKSTTFQILQSARSEETSVHLPPDQSLCDDCRTELHSPHDRRSGYPFLNCTQCGPRYTLITALPYDRAATSMAGFTLCPQCRSEYENPADRRFHAEPVACPECGPWLSYVGAGHPRVEGNAAALATGLARLRAGGILAVKGVGGYHLLCDAANAQAVSDLRQRKHRPDKPLAVLFPRRGADGCDAVREHAVLDGPAARALADPACPIVLVPRKSGGPLCDALAPGLDELGALLPYSPLHELLAEGFGAPLVATSGNISGEPVITDNGDAHARLGAIADAFLDHNRPIVRPADDSVVRVIDGTARLIRPGRGTAPLELPLTGRIAEPVLALGGQQKVTVAIGEGQRAIISPHIGDLESPRSQETFARVLEDMPQLHGVTPQYLVCDAHPGYASGRWAKRQHIPVIPVGHHAAHASALAGEFPDVGTWLVFAWDGTGYGADGTLWGGEALGGTPGRWRRLASFRPFHPPGGERVSREPWRSAAALCWSEGVDYAPPASAPEAAIVRTAWARGLNAPQTSAVGRLFDAAAALVLDIRTTSYEAQAAMLLECAARQAGTPTISAPSLGLARDGEGVLRADWGGLLATLTDHALDPRDRAAAFHLALASTLTRQASRLHAASPFDAVGLTGGVFQNRLLAEIALQHLRAAGFETFLPARVPANDGGLAFGQIVEATARLRQSATTGKDDQL